MARKKTLRDGTRRPRPFHSARQEAALGVLRTADILKRRFATVFEPLDLTMQQFNVLRILRGARPDPLPTMEIAERMLEKTPGITRLIDRLEQKGLVARERGAEDRRCVYVAIAPAGLDLLAELDEPVAKADDEAMSMLSVEEAERLVELLDIVRAGGS